MIQTCSTELKRKEPPNPEALEHEVGEGDEVPAPT